MNGTAKPVAIINHVALVLDASSSMHGLNRSVVKVADGLIADLAKLSQDMDQETRVTVYTFSDKVECVVYDKDVLRLPSIASYYTPYGNTALLRATSEAIDDLNLTATKYGDHSFLLYVITDGEENASDYIPGTWTNQRGVASFKETTPAKIASLDDNWTLACLVPSAKHVFHTKKFGFPANNIAVWDATSERGMEEAGRAITVATTTYMTNRASGLRGTSNLFSTGADAVNKATVSSLTPLDPGKDFILSHVTEDTRIDSWIRDSCGLTFRIGMGHYQLTKREKIQAGKKIGILEKATGRVYYGPEARQLIGLPDIDVSVKPDHNKDYDIFVQSLAPNRKLLAHTKLLIIT